MIATTTIRPIKLKMEVKMGGQKTPGSASCLRQWNKGGLGNRSQGRTSGRSSKTCQSQELKPGIQLVLRQLLKEVKKHCVRNLDHRRGACLRIPSRCEPTAIGSAGGTITYQQAGPNEIKTDRLLGFLCFYQTMHLSNEILGLKVYLAEVKV